MGEAFAADLKSHVDCQTISKILLLTSIKTLWPAHTLTSSKDRCLGAYSIGLITVGKLGCKTIRKSNATVLRHRFFKSDKNILDAIIPVKIALDCQIECVNKLYMISLCLEAGNPY
jgi:hypothetical protein